MKKKQRTSRRPGFRITERDNRIIEAAFRFRFIDFHLIHLLFGEDHHVASKKSNSRLTSRVRSLESDGLFMRHTGARAVKGQPGGNAYALAPQGAKYLFELSEENERYNIPPSTLEKQRTYRFIEHELLVGYALAAISRAANHHGIEFSMVPYFDSEHFYAMCKEAHVNPDGFFSLTNTSSEGEPVTVNHFLEIDRGSLELKRDAVPRYKHYFNWLKNEDTRVITLTSSPRRVERFRAETASIGKNPPVYRRAWRGLWFGHFGEGPGAFNPRDPLSIFGKIFQYPDGNEKVSMLKRVHSSPR